MRSSTGEHYVGLDHIRALAAFMVFCWHFLDSVKLPKDYAPGLFPFALLDQGHTGVALFMTLSGYLFAKLLNGRQVNYSAFFWNRFIRLAPILVIVLSLTGLVIWVKTGRISDYLWTLVRGVYAPSWPNGAWSLTCEIHFYLLLPLLLWLMRRRLALTCYVVGAAIVLRTYYQLYTVEVREIAYWTIFGRIDQFTLGICAFYLRDVFRDRGYFIFVAALIFCGFYWYLDTLGGYTHTPCSALWIIIPTIEALFYGAAIAWYDQRYIPKSQASTFAALIGKYSYSIYLMHPLFVFHMAPIIGNAIAPITNFYVAILSSMVGFLLMVPLGHLCWVFVEAPFLKLRRKYIVAADERPASYADSTYANSMPK